MGDRRQLHPYIHSNVIEVSFLMRVEIVAVLTTTVLLLNGLLGEGTSLPVANEPQRARLRRPLRRKHKPPPKFVLIFSNHRPSKMKDFGNQFPSTGRFCPHHKMGRCTLVEAYNDTPQFWGIAIATPGTAIAKPTPQASPPLSPSHRGRAEVGGCGSWGTGYLQKSRLPPQQHQPRKQHGRRRRRRQRAHEADDYIVGWLASPLHELRAQASSKWGAVIRWTSERCNRSLVFARLPSRRLEARQRKIDSATRGIVQLVAQIPVLTVEARRRTGNAFSAVRMFGESGIKYLSESIRYHGLGEGFDAASDNMKEYGQQYGGSWLARLTDMTVQNVVDVVARDGWEHVVTTSGVVVHRQYIALDPDGTPVPSSALETEAETGVEQVAASVPVATEATPAIFERGLGVTDGEALRRTPRFACVKASAILSAPPEVVYLLFADNSRVREYNEHCKEVMDLEILSPDTKITWAASGRIGPFKVREPRGVRRRCGFRIADDLNFFMNFGVAQCC